ncbi:hypothetical protein P4O66_003516, partial [Electrophorus voltai]
MGVIEPSS